MPGVFYRKPDPDDPPFFEEGDRVEAETRSPSSAS